MIWLTWRQARGQTLATLAALAVLTIYLIWLGLSIRHFNDTRIVGCTSGQDCAIAEDDFTNSYGFPLALVGALLIGLPGIIGVFWGAPLITRELESGTHRMVWNQSVTRTQWLAVKLGLITLIAVAVAGALSLLLTWAAEPFDKLIGNRFTVMTFDSRDVVPFAYAAFALVLGITVGLLIRRTLPAMALTLVLFTVVQIVMPMAVRPHLRTPVTSVVAFDQTAAQEIDSLGSGGGPAAGDSAPMKIGGYRKPGAWMLSSAPVALLRADGSAFTRGDMKTCMTGDFPQDMLCLAKQDLHFSVQYHPAGRYWTFQWIEMSVFLVLALALSGLCFWRIPRTTSR
jgi:ABC-type transport system involved in multi-copper enzyme maturation permease subunit